MNRWAAMLASLVLVATAHAHIASNGFLVAKVAGNEVSGSLELAVRDVELAIGIDANGDGKVTWGELRAPQRLPRHRSARLRPP